MRPKAFSFTHINTSNTQIDIQDIVYKWTINNIVCFLDFMHVWFGAENHGYTSIYVEIIFSLDLQTLMASKFTEEEEERKKNTYFGQTEYK